jgi:hypothetical protein
MADESFLVFLKKEHFVLACDCADRARDCHVPGTWTDAYSYTWKLKKSGAGRVTGTVDTMG